MIPQETVNVLRQRNDISVLLYGIDCTLHIPNNLEQVDTNDIYTVAKDYYYDDYITKVFIEWKPNIYRLKNMGISVDDVPILAWFSNKLIDVNGVEKYVSTYNHSWFSVSLQFVPAGIGVAEFEVVDVVIPAMHDAVISQYYKISPRRVK